MLVQIINIREDAWYKKYKDAMFEVEVVNEEIYAVSTEKFKGKIIKTSDCTIIIEPKDLKPYKDIISKIKSLMSKAEELKMVLTEDALSVALYQAEFELNEERIKRGIKIK